MKVHSERAPGAEQPGAIRRFVESRLIGNFDSETFSDAWKKKFSHAPTWCDADMSLQQINRGKAVGNRVALYARAFFQLWLYRIGCFVQRFAWSTILISMVLYTLCLGGLQHVVIETDLVKLWVSEGGRLNEEMGYLGAVKHEREHQIHKVKRAIEKGAEPVPVKAETRRGPELPKENGLGGGFQVVIQTPSFQGENVLTKEALQRHTKLMQEISGYEVKMFNETWTLSDICFKPPGPSFNSGPLAGIMSKLLDKIIPCIWITPVDCYWDGAKSLGPNPPLNLGPEVASFISSLPPGNVTWKNLNPTSVIKEVGQLFDLGPIGNFFERAGIDGAYLDRPCIDPLEEECPKSAPNYFNRCLALEKFNAWNLAKSMSEQVALERKPLPKEDGKSDIAENLLNDIFGKKRRKRQTEEKKEEKPKSDKSKKDEDYYAYEDDADYLDGINNSTNGSKKSERSEKEIECLEYGASLLAWMQKNPDRLGEFLTKEEMPEYPNYGDVMTGGCKGFGKKIMEWPEDLIIGGIERENGKLVSAEALQSVFLVSSPYDVFVRIANDKTDSHPGLDRHSFQPWMAGEIITAWQRNFTKKLYGHKENQDGLRVFHPLASTSIADMLEEFSQFNYIIIIIGYVLMVIYAAFTQGRFQGYWLAIQSNVALAISGVILVTFSSICGLGFATHLGINFNAATTQVVPFLSLGLGIDDMFLLLHNYDEIINICNKNEIGILLKETGMSVMVTSINNILAFISGYVLPIPALRSFCSQTAILLLFNLLFLMFIFPAMIGIDLRRQRKGKRDLAYCSRGTPQMANSQSVPSAVSNMSSRAELSGYDKQAEEFKRHEPWYTVGGFLNNIYIPALKNNVCKAIILCGTATAVLFGLYGMYTSTLGLELADVLPEHTPPAAFLRAREKYFSFYPMFAVLRGNQIDIPNQQQLIEEYRAQLGSSKFMIKAEGKLQPYWMSMMRIWLKSLDAALEVDLKAGKFDLTNGNPLKINGEKPSPESMIAARLVCSAGATYDCKNRLGKIKMVDENDVINPEGFYNYLTGWFNVDNMMYYVSQASFYPAPPGWEYNEKMAKVVPASEPLLYSQIPFYQNDLVDTPAIVKMIEEIRATCEEYTERGLPNYPSGIAFTFWEQYLSLRFNLFMAIVIIAAAVFTVISILMFNPWAATLIMCIVIITTIELGGFMGLMGIKMNPISAVTLICAVGIGVEFTAHVELAFLTSLGTINQRLESCLQHMFVPVYHGAISTFLGVVMLVFSEFDFVVKYFFYTMTVLVGLGVFNGLCVLPVILTLVGPEPELTPTSGESVLPAPPSLRQQQSEKSGGVEGGMRKRKEKVAEVEMSARDSPSSSSDEENQK